LFPFKEIDGRVVKQLPSYEDRNYYLAGTTTAGGESMEEFVLKISNSLMDIEVVEGLNAVTSHLHRQGFNCPQPVPSRKGIAILKISKEQLLTGDPGAREGRKEFCVRLLTFIPGETLDSVPYTPRLAYEAGRYLGSMDAALQVCMPSGTLAAKYHWDRGLISMLSTTNSNLPRFSQWLYIIQTQQSNELNVSNCNEYYSSTTLNAVHMTVLLTQRSSLA